MEAFIDHINIRIPEDCIEEALNFYRDILGLEPWKLEEYRNDDRTSFFLRIGEGSLLNIRPVKDFERPEGLNLDHFCIVMEADISELKQSLKDNGYEILREGKPLGIQGRAPAVYVEDPFGYTLELKKLV